MQRVNPDWQGHKEDGTFPGGSLRFVRRVISKCNEYCDKPCRCVTHQVRPQTMLQQYQYSKVLKKWDWFDIPLETGDDL